MTSIEHGGWRISSVQRPILNAGEIDAATARLGIPLPEMIFGNNLVELVHVASGWTLRFDALDALDRVDKTGTPDGGLVKVSYAEAWLKFRSRNEDVHDVVRPFDWTYTTDYKGTGTGFAPGTMEIPFDRLRRPDPILFFAENMLFEDELGDNGTAEYNVRVRVMDGRLLVLARFFLRVDDVMMRVRDTRVFVEFGTGEVVREYVARQAPYTAVKARLPPSADFGLYLRDANWVAEQLPVVERTLESATVN
ncbi:TIP41-domain-containing protein [Dipodascopsis tothii]|uniref:TIP41-domain-containing protein n=1 Tax=Dipodascopsis tothii TaxID=44089 RepID=UPI0034CD688B